MNPITSREFPVDNASILFLSLMRPYHSNNFRISVTLHEPVCPEALQKAVDRVTPRLPSVIASLQPGFFHYRQVAVAQPPKVMPDPGLLHTPSKEDMKESCFQVYYKDCTISIEAFHAMTDGYGGLTTITTLVAEYLKERCGLEVPVGLTRLDPDQEPQAEEVADDFLKMTDAPARHLPSRFSYLPTRSDNSDWQVRSHAVTINTRKLLEVAHRYGVTLNTLLTSVLASTVMDMQLKEKGSKGLKPVRIMVPVDLRRLVGSRTLRNFSLYTLPTMEVSQKDLPLEELCKVFGDQLKQQLSKESLTSMVAYNVKSQTNPLFRAIPWKLKSAALRIGYRFFGESNSSLTLTNLGVLKFPEEMLPYIADFRCWLTPRISSPYGCTVISFNDEVILNMSYFGNEDKVGNAFFKRLQEMVEA